MYSKQLVGVGILFALTLPALADEFFIVQNPATKRCSVSDRPPEPSTGIVVGDGAYGDRASAEADMKTIMACIQS